MNFFSGILCTLVLYIQSAFSYVLIKFYVKISRGHDVVRAFMGHGVMRPEVSHNPGKHLPLPPTPFFGFNRFPLGPCLALVPESGTKFYGPDALPVTALTVSKH